SSKRARRSRIRSRSAICVSRAASAGDTSTARRRMPKTEREASALPALGYSAPVVPHELTRLDDGTEPQEALLAAEVPVALVYNGRSHAVMMCTPADLEDFAYGFTVTEGIADVG